MIVPRSLFSGGLTIEPRPPLDDEIGARARSAWGSNPLSLENYPEIFNKNSVLIVFLSGRVK